MRREYAERMHGGDAGLIAGERSEYDGLPVIDALTNIEALADLIEEKSSKRVQSTP